MSLSHAINQFFADRNVQNAIDASRETSPLQICYPKELEVSRFLAWLLDPTQGHGLDGSALRALLVACWRNAEEAGINAVTRRRFAPGAMAAQSFMDVVIEREVRFESGYGQLDLLVLLPRQRMLIAIENKFGARLGADQLARYRKALEHDYDGWTQVLVYLDIDGRIPDDEGWIGLDYAWLTEELRVAECSAWLADEPRRAIREFRGIFDLGSDEAELPGLGERELQGIVRAHPAVFAQLTAWEDDPRRLSELAIEVFDSNATEDDKALQSLFPLYCQRRALWRQCFPMMSHAGLLEHAQNRFSDLLCEPKRRAFYFTLERWNDLQADDSGYWTVLVMVRLQPDDEGATEKFAVVSYINFGNVADEHRAAMEQHAEQLRSQHMKRRRKLDDEQQYVTVRVTYAKKQENAAIELQRHLAELDLILRPLQLSA